jgi:hypothetical protein
VCNQNDQLLSSHAKLHFCRFRASIMKLSSSIAHTRNTRCTNCPDILESRIGRFQNSRKIDFLILWFPLNTFCTFLASSKACVAEKEKESQLEKVHHVGFLNPSMTALWLVFQTQRQPHDLIVFARRVSWV